MRIFIFSFIFFLLAGCSLKQETLRSSAYLITIKNQNIALSDTGFINIKEHSKTLQIFSAGSVVLNLHVEDKNACMDFTCIEKERFNEEFFGYKHYRNLIDELLSFQPIYEAKNIHKTNDGSFEQIFSSKVYDIEYKVTKNSLYFKDRKNKVLIKLRKLGERQ